MSSELQAIGSPLLDSDLEALAKGWLDQATVTSALIRRVDREQGAEICGRKPGEGDYAGMAFPYLWPGEDPTKQALGLTGRAVRQWRLRRDHPEIRIEAGGVRKTVGKYLSSPGTPNMLFFHPATPPDLLADDDLPIVITEGEKKTLALWRLAWHETGETAERPRFLPVGLSGVFNWRGKVGKEDAPDGGKRVVKGPIPDLDRIEWHERRVIILYDSNVHTHEDVKRARLELARHLFHDRHARVYFADLPRKGAEEGINGVDDFLAARGPEKTLKIIDGAREVKLRANPDEPAPPDKDDRIVKILSGCEWIQTPNAQLFVSLAVNGHRETVGLRSRQFGSYLMRRIRDVDGKAPTTQVINEVRAYAEAEADAAPAATSVPLRVARAGEKILLDLATPGWEVIEIDAGGWRYAKAETMPVRFRRSRTMSAHVTPMPGGSLELLRSWCNAEQDENFILICAWLVGALAPTGPYPVLNIRGEQGSAKSTTSKILRLLIDPAGRAENYYSGAIKSLPKDERDLMISAANSWVLVFDNTSGIKPEMSDCLCRLSTGGAFSTRQLHSDDEEMVFEAMRPLLLNGIDDMATMPDLVDRSLMIDLPAIPESRRRPESEFWREFDAQRGRIVGALLDAVAAAQRHVGSVELKRAPRMADFAKWVVAACRGGALPFTEERFLDVYFGNRSDAVAQAIEASPLATQVEKLARELQRWEGTAGELLAVLNDRVSEGLKLSKSWPKDVRAVGNRIRRVAPLLRSAGLRVQTDIRTGHARSRVMVFEVPIEETPGNDVRVCPQGDFFA